MAARITPAEEVASWAEMFAQPDGLGHHGNGLSAAGTIRHALLEQATDTRNAEGDAREEVPGAGGLLYRGVPTLIFGERGHGKSTVALAAGLGAAEAGEHVLYLDRENGPALTAERIEVRPEWVGALEAERFVGRHYPELDPAWTPDSVGEAIGGAGFTVVIYDSAREMFAQLRLDPDRERDVSRFVSLAVTPLARRGVCVVLLDNVGHENADRPKGSASKLDAMPQGFRVRTVERFSPTVTGRVTINCTRSRFGDLDREWTLRVGGGVFEAPRTRSEAPDARRMRERERREQFRCAAVAALHEDAPLGRDALIAAARERGAKGRSDGLRRWLAEFASDSASGLISTDEGFIVEDPRSPDPAGVGQVGVRGSLPVDPTGEVNPVGVAPVRQGPERSGSAPAVASANSTTVPIDPANGGLDAYATLEDLLLDSAGREHLRASVNGTWVDDPADAEGTVWDYTGGGT